MSSCWCCCLPFSLSNINCLRHRYGHMHGLVELMTMLMSDFCTDGSSVSVLTQTRKQKRKIGQLYGSRTSLRLFTRSCICTMESRIGIGLMALHHGVWRVLVRGGLLQLRSEAPTDDMHHHSCADSRRIYRSAHSVISDVSLRHGSTFLSSSHRRSG